jgi:hypothetical protein
MKFSSGGFALSSWIVVWSICVALSLSTGGSTAIAQILPGAKCPSDFTCLPSEPRDGVCQHPLLVLDPQTKSIRYEGDRFSRAGEKACIVKTNSLATHRGAELTLKLSNGTAKVYKDNQSKAACEGGPYESCKTYMLYDFFPEHGLFLVNVAYNESNEWILVRQRDGREVQVVAPPGYSPNRKWLASVYWTDGPDDRNNGIDIVPANLNATDLAFHYRPKEYELWEYVGWDKDDRLLLKVTWHAGGDSKLVTWPAEVVRVNGTWQLNKWPPASPRP